MLEAYLNIRDREVKKELLNGHTHSVTPKVLLGANNVVSSMYTNRFFPWLLKVMACAGYHSVEMFMTH